MTVGQFKESLIGMAHSGTLNKVRNFEALLERAGNVLLQKIDPVETERTIPLAQVIYDDLFNYPLPSDYKKPIDLYPQDNRGTADVSRRVTAEPFDFQKAVTNKTISIEGSEGSKFMRVNWQSHGSKVLNAMDSLTANGTWSVVASAANLIADSLYFIAGSASVRFDVVASGDGIQNTTMGQVDLTSVNLIGACIFAIYIPDSTKLTSITAIWGDDLTTKFWTGVAQTAQADGTAFKNGWNWIRVPWDTATQTGTVVVTQIDSFKLTLATTGALAKVRVDNIMFALGRAFDFKYYGKYLVRNSAGTWLSRTTSDDDTIVLDSDGINLYLFETLKAIAQQTEGEDSAFDINYANKELHGDPSASNPKARAGLYRVYTAEHPSLGKKAVQRYSSGPRFRG